MYSHFLQRMENHIHQGDLADIVLASGGAITGTSGEPPLFFHSDPMNYTSGIDTVPMNDHFGDPFSNMMSNHPLLHELDIPGSGFFEDSKYNSSTAMIKGGVEDNNTASVGYSGVFGQNTIDDEMKRPSNIFSRMLQISPNNTKLPVPRCDSPVVVAASPRGIRSPGLIANDVISGNSSKGLLFENTAGVQISSPRHSGIKRRKSQAKKVVCIPAPAPANSRPSSGEVVPSDLWAWRKYGQKPIKGSPYPRGYYRCSSSKGCSARKQVERSRTDPNMLVITYTSEHNHPWPTQRNALAGSTRSQPSKNTAASKNSPSSQSQKTTSLNEEQKESLTDNVSSSIVTESSTTGGPSVKEEMEELDHKQMDIDDGDQFSEGFPQTYRPALPDYYSNQSEDFFAELGEIEADPLNLLFTQGFSAGDEERESNKKALDPFSIFDWTGNNNNNTSFGEAKRGL
ncbi:probable WRKY transcription factor 14 [Cornus florida]|uniref:probable WRKY transcription factor 14 n=1 Tax=Cornus florida TaxID=4283 RepID=UPI00289C6D52|nr:probable WRKY transcription factor 14 [Cornus florida]